MNIQCKCAIEALESSLKKMDDLVSTKEKAITNCQVKSCTGFDMEHLYKMRASVYSKINSIINCIDEMKTYAENIK